MFADAPDEFADEALSFFDEADTLPLPLTLALPEALTFVLLTTFFALFAAAAADAVAFALFALNVAAADAVLFAAAEKVLLAAAFALLALACAIALPLALPELVKLALLLVRLALPFEVNEPLAIVLPLSALALVED